MGFTQKGVYFAAVNSSGGFRSYFKDLFEPEKFRSVYLIKGGPGTGKSGLMRTISSRAQELGLYVEEYLCSSDPASLDGVVIPAIGFGIMDATSPHSAEPKIPGAVENLFNTGAFWDKDKLFQNREQILELIRLKSRAYREGYRLLACAGEIAREIMLFSTEDFQWEKMRRAAASVAKKTFLVPGTKITEPRLQTAFGAGGFMRLDTFEKAADTVRVVHDRDFTGFAFLAQIEKEAEKAGEHVYRSVSPLFPEYPDALYFPREKCAFILREKDAYPILPQKTYEVVNMARFISPDARKANRQKIRFGKKCLDMLLSESGTAFAEAKKHHAVLETIYTASMDFPKMQEAIAEFCDRIF